MPNSAHNFSRAERLITRQDFQAVFDQPCKKLSQRYFLALFKQNQQADARLGVVAAKRTAKRAVDRNRIKRIVRESFRHQKQCLKGLNVVVLLRSKSIPIHDKKALREDIDLLWQRLTSSS